jgi:hypothetical protein
VPDVGSHSFGKSLAMLIDVAGLSVGIGADHLGQAKASMTHDGYASRGRVHAKVTQLLDSALVTDDSAVINGELTMTVENRRHQYTP